MRAILLPLLLVLPVLAGDDTEAVVRRCAELSTRLEALLGPKFEESVPVEVVDGAFIENFARETAEKQMPEELQELTERLFVRFKLLPAGFDLMESQVEMLRASISGLYDAEKDRFYIVGARMTPGTPGFDITAAHELAHAYRDVDKDYWERLLKLMPVDEDRAIALSCLVEGEAQMIGEIVGAGGDPEKLVPIVIARSKDAPKLIPTVMGNPMLRKFPLFMREMLISRYFIGQAFAAHVYENGGWAALAKAYDEPPQSTEQILHPQKYRGEARDGPTRIEGGDPAAALGEGWKRVYTNTAGEFAIRLQFIESLGRVRSTRVAEGWDGGRYYVCEKEGAPLLVGSITVWDTEDDAKEFANAWADWAAARDTPGAEAAAAKREGDTYRVETKDGLVVVRRAGTSVFVADGVPPERAAAALDALASAKLIP